MTDLTKEEIARLRELEAKATPGPWEESNVPSEPRIQCEARGEEIAWVFGTEKRTTENFANRALIVAIRNALPTLLDAAERAEFAVACSQTDIDKRIAADAQRDLALAAKDLYAERALAAEAERDRLRAMVDQDTAELTGPVYEQIKALTVERDRLAAENAALSEQNASMKAGRRPFSGAMAERTIALQVREIDRLAARVAALEAGSG